MHTLPRTIVATCLTAAAVGLAPLAVAAQEEQAQEACTAIVSPDLIPVGEQAVQLTLNLSHDVGPISGLETIESAGPKIADPANLPRTEMAAEAAPPELIEMSGENVWRVWISTENVEPGLHPLTFVGSQGRCTAEVTLQPAG